MKNNILIVGAGGVANVVAHKCAQHNDVFGDLCIASRTLEKCESIVAGVRRKGNMKDPAGRFRARRLDAMDIPATVALIRELDAAIVINVGSPFINMSVLQACIETGAAYMDTAIHEDPEQICEPPPWYANYEWKRRDACAEKGVTAILGVGFDPGVVNAYAAYAQKHYFDKIDTVDIMDVNAGDHGKYFATNFDAEINFREFTGTMWEWIDRQWVGKPAHSVSREYDFPVVGKRKVYLTGHDELHSLSRNMDANSIRFWMGFSDHYINVFNVLKNIGLLSEHPVRTAEGQEVVPLKVVKACLPDPASLAPGYTGKTCIGDLVTGEKDGERRSVFLYNVCDHHQCYEEVESQAISYTAGVPPVAAALLIARGDWDVGKMVNVEELDPDPFLGLLNEMGLKTEVVEEG